MTELIPIRKGFYLVERKNLLPFRKSASYLNSRRKKHITRIEETLNGVQIIRHAFRCPCCGKEVFAYDHNRDEFYEEKESFPTREDIEDWCDLQRDMFSTETKPPLHFQKPLSEKGSFLCPRCKSVSKQDEGEISLVLEIKDKIISLSRPIENFDDLLSIPWIKRVSLKGDEILSEKVSFDLQSASVILSLENEEGVSIAARFLNRQTSEEELGFFWLLLSKNKVVKRKLKSAFQSFCRNPIPFSLRELDFNKFLLLTLFSDFPISFYNALPLEHDSGRMMEDFFYPASLLHSPESAMKVLKETGIPYTKSVKRLFTQKPGLFFYLPECKSLWVLLKDLNYYCTLLRVEHIFYLLAALHQYPGALQFYEDFRKICGEKALLKLLKVNFQAANNRAIAYAALSPAVKERVQSTMKEQKDCGSFCYAIPPVILFSHPLGTPPRDGREIAIDGFTFRWLKNTGDCQIAAKELNNCLTEWNGGKNPVAVVLQNKKYVAAIEVRDDHILQALGHGNDPIEENTPLYNAIEKWTDHFSFKRFSDDMDDLPF